MLICAVEQAPEWEDKNQGRGEMVWGSGAGTALVGAAKAVTLASIMPGLPIKVDGGEGDFTAKGGEAGGGS